uniref:PRELI/MSF1 domain-containing protein n=1 Tax=Knipowitschia caucasica TaxID=637954 RepID=A0AAV2KNC1_KNICA
MQNILSRDWDGTGKKTQGVGGRGREAYVRRFPTCPLIPVLVDCQVLSESQSEDGSVLQTERRCTIDIEIPRLLKRITGLDYLYFIQKNTLNRRDRTLDIRIHNETFSSRVLVREHCRYTVHPENENWTCYEQTASMDIKSFFGFESTAEKIVGKQYASNIKKGKEIIEYYLTEMEQEGITFIPRWTPPALSSPTAAIPVTFPRDPPSSCPTELAGSPDDKLDADYIRRYLGDLTPLQESCLIRLRQWLQDCHKGKRWERGRQYRKRMLELLDIFLVIVESEMMTF